MAKKGKGGLICCMCLCVCVCVCIYTCMCVAKIILAAVDLICQLNNNIFFVKKNENKNKNKKQRPKITHNHTVIDLIK